MFDPRLPVAPRRAALAMGLAATLAALAPVPLELHAQQRDSARVGAAPPAADTAARRAPVADTVPGPPISPKRAFFSSVLVPGLGQSALDRPIAGTLFVAMEAISLVMIQKSLKELAFARRVGGIGVQCPSPAPEGQLCLDPVDPDSDEPPTPNRYSGGRLTARRQHVEDWIALLVANHLLAGADAYVAAHLWDLPARISIQPTDRGVAAAASVAW